MTVRSEVKDRPSKHPMARCLRLPQHCRARLPRSRSRTCPEIVTDDLPLLRAGVANELNVKHCANAAFRRPHVARWGLEASPARRVRCRRRPRTDEGRRCGDDRCAPAKPAAFLRWRARASRRRQARLGQPPGARIEPAQTLASPGAKQQCPQLRLARARLVPQRASHDRTRRRSLDCREQQRAGSRRFTYELGDGTERRATP
jgi:hypothetical protein